MKKIILILATIILMHGCSNTDSSNTDYQGKALEIGVVGTNNLPSFTNVKYEFVELESLVENNYDFDAVIITESAFSEADKDKYVKFFNEVRFPIFFFGIEGFRIFAFTKEGISMDMARDENSAYVQGFKNIGETRHGWKFYESKNMSSENRDVDMLLRIFEELNNSDVGN